jgi:hypothetical protein
MLYLDCSCLNLALGIFLKFLEFFGYFSWLYRFIKTFLDLSLPRKIFRKKNKSILSNWAEPEGPTQSPSSRRRHGRGPRGAHLGPHRAAGLGRGRRRLPRQACPARAPIKARRLLLRRP